MRNALVILMLLVSTALFSQTKQMQQYNNGFQPTQTTLEDELSYTGTFQTVQHLDWQKAGNSCYGCISFYWGVTRSRRRDAYGNFWFDIWFYSNSFNNYGYRVSTTVSGIYVYLNGQKYNREPAWVTFFDSYTYYGLRIKTRQMHPKIIIDWSKASM